MGFFDDLLKTAVTEETDRATIAEMATKYPALRTSFESNETDLQRWEAWKLNNWDSDAAKTKSQIEAERRVAALEAAGNFGGAEVTFEQMKADLEREGYVRRSDLATAIADPTGKDPVFQAVRGVVNNSASGIEYFFRKAGTLPMEYFAEFGKVDPQLNDKLLDAYGKAPAGTDPRAIYDQIVAPEREVRRAAAETAKEEAHKADLARVAKETEERVRREVGMSAGTPGMPTDQGGPNSSMGPLQRQQMERFSNAEKQTPLSSAPLGSGIVAREGLAWLQEQRANGTIQ